MTQFASSNFTGTNGQTLPGADSNFTQHPSYTAQQAVIANNRVRANNNNASQAYYHSGTPASADYDVSADCYFPSGGVGTTGAGVTGRMSTSANTLYHARFVGGTGWQLYKFVAGTATQIGSSISFSPSSDSTTNLRLGMSGTTISLYKAGEGTATISGTDSAISSAGKAGIRFNGVSATDTFGTQLDNFSGDDAAAGTSTYTYSGAGTVTLSGTAALDKIKSYAGTGTTTLSGAAAAARTRAWNGAGTVALSGAATTALVAPGSTTFTYSGAGTVALSGAASVDRWRAWEGSGSVTLSGAAAVDRWRSSFGTGTITLSGAATTAITAPGATTYPYFGGGLVAFSGSAILSRTGSFTGSGSVVLSGTAETSSLGATTLTAADIKAIAAGVWDEVLEDSVTARKFMRAFAAFLANDAEGFGTPLESFKSRDGTKVRATSTVDGAGRRTVNLTDLN